MSNHEQDFIDGKPVTQEDAVKYLHNLVYASLAVHSGGNVRCSVCGQLQCAYAAPMVESVECTPMEHTPDCAWKLAYEWLLTQEETSETN